MNVLTISHPQTFIVTGRRRADVQKPFAAPIRCEHLPQYDDDWHPIYRVIGEGLDYLSCPQCFPNSRIDEAPRQVEG